MKKISIYGIMFLVLFGVAYVIYNQQTSQSTSNTEMKVALSSEEVSSESIASSETATESSSSESFSLKVANQLDETLSLAPDTQFEDVEGNVHQLRDMKGLPTVINIWASWCPPCRAEMPHFEAASTTYQDRVQFLMINATGSSDTETKETVQAFIEETGFSAPVYYDVNFVNQIKFGATSLPTTILLNDRGQVAKIIRGMVSEEQLISEVEGLLQ